jgi:hypothetical protein
MDQLRVVLSPVLNDECFNKFLIDYNFGDGEGFKFKGFNDVMGL